jgi:predicted GNAT family acetyltransferase
MSDVLDNPAESRFELDIDGHVAVVQYRLSPGVITFTHTDVPKALAGRGVGSTLARGALDHVRSRGLNVIAQCEFIAGYLGKHPEYADMVAPRPA